jgi:hypothetical protein
MEATGSGYWLMGSDGGVFAFPDAPYFGRATFAGAPGVGMAATPAGAGYWQASTDGSVFNYGDAPAF